MYRLRVVLVVPDAIEEPQYLMEKSASGLEASARADLFSVKHKSEGDGVVEAAKLPCLTGTN